MSLNVSVTMVTQEQTARSILHNTGNFLHQYKRIFVFTSACSIYMPNDYMHVIFKAVGGF